jgi:O-antigen ligase
VREQITRELLTKVILAGLILLPISILPYSAIDPINTPQLAVLVVVAFISFGIAIEARNSIDFSRFRLILGLLSIFNLNLVMVFIFSKANLGLQFYGTFGRNTGLLTYISLSIILFSVVLVSNEKSLMEFSKVFYLIGLVATIYGVIQFIGLDPVPWDNIFSPVIGFLGNPNFQSALLGICGVIVFTKLLDAGTWKIKIFGAIFLLVLVFTIYQTNSKQGLLNLLAGAAIVIWIYVKEIGQQKLTRLVTVFMFFFGSLVALGVFNYGPLGEILYKRSVSARIFYWEAGLKMTLEHPLWGVGLDNYGDWFRRTRTSQAATEFGPDSVSDVAHNVLLDFSSNGGLPLLGIYVCLIAITTLSIVRVIKRQNKFNLAHSALVGAWVSYQVQSLVSINQLALVFIGWVLSGLLIGYEISTTDRVKEVEKIKSPKTKSNQVLHPKYVLIVFITGTLGFLVGAQPMISSIKFRSALESGQIDRIQDSAKLFPLEQLRIYQVASILKDNKFDKEALDVVEMGLKNFPDSYILWRILSEFPGVPESQIAQIKAKMRELDPKNKEI